MVELSESWKWILKFTNFFILLWILVKFGKKHFQNFLLGRHTKVKERIDEADKLLAEAESLKGEYAAKLAKLDKEIEAFKAQVTEETKKESEKLVEEARAFAAKIEEQARLTYEQEKREISGRIKEEIAKLALEKAERLVVEKVSATDNDKIIEEFIEKLRSLN
ncbi:MAG: ATP synthase F0 subunit B [Syntrophobacterales bacterium]|jgi:F-type H+-transporting ATPase subunit b|nr:ATP synthase F0 subunit B [Syntrophobacterales bacterium]